jgi:hypothetical protein
MSASGTDALTTRHLTFGGHDDPPIMGAQRDGVKSRRKWRAVEIPFLVEGALLHERKVAPVGEGGGMRLRCSRPAPAIPRSAFAGSRFPPAIIVLALRRHLRHGLSYRRSKSCALSVGSRSIHVTIYRWVQRFTSFLADAAGPRRHLVGDRWFVDETYVKVAGKWRTICGSWPPMPSSRPRTDV